ncbi:MAG: MFS transporter [Rhodobacteraceae bacterium]|nr:MFS transporter [Paracoccaceae bacterium]
MQNSMSRVEFISFIAVMFATIAFSIDSILPALPEIGAELSPDDVNRAQLVLIAFVFGMGLGTFFTGPLSDTFGRKPVIYVGSMLYIASAAVAWAAQSLELLLVARVFQGIGAAAPRIVAIAVVRDLYSGREMARIMSIAMMIFTIFPALAPLMATGIIAFIGWRGIFLAFILFSVVSILWMRLRLPEPLAIADRRPFRAGLLWGAVLEMFANPTVRLTIMVQTMCFAVLFSLLTMVQQIYDTIFDQGDNFPFWFGAIALVSGSASILNAILVVRVGMRRMVTWSIGVMIILTTLMFWISTIEIALPIYFGFFVVWQACVFFMTGTTLGNLNAIAMEPMGHIAGMAASVIGSISTVTAAIIVAPIGLMFDGTLLPLTAGALSMLIIGFLLMLKMGRIEKQLAH